MKVAPAQRGPTVVAPRTDGRNTSSRRPARIIGKLMLACLMLAGCQPDMAGSTGSDGMFGLFKAKIERLPSSVSPRLHAQLKRQASFPAVPVARRYPGCSSARVIGIPPAARFVADDYTGTVQDAFRVAGSARLPPLAIVNIGAATHRPQFWRLVSDADATFAEQLHVQLDPSEKGWITAGIEGVGCLPGSLLALGLGWSDGRSFQSIALYDRAANKLRTLSQAAYAAVSGATNDLLDTREAGSDTALLLYHTDDLRLRAEIHARKYDHVMLFSARYPQGLEVLTLGLDDGNVVEWNVIGGTLWLHAQDRRDRQRPKEYFWSLDLTSVL